MVSCVAYTLSVLFEVAAHAAATAATAQAAAAAAAGPAGVGGSAVAAGEAAVAEQGLTLLGRSMPNPRNPATMFWHN